MADRIDLLISDYMTGMLLIKIKAREKWLREQNIEAYDSQLQNLRDKKEVMDQVMTTIDQLLIKQIIIARFKYRLTWVNVGHRVCVEESTARKQYVKFKKEIRGLIGRYIE